MGYIMEWRISAMKLHVILPGDMKHREMDTALADQHALPTGSIMIPDDIWLRLEKELGGRERFLALLNSTESDRRD